MMAATRTDLSFALTEFCAPNYNLIVSSRIVADFDSVPIANPEQDRFGFDPFARPIARRVLALKRPLGSVVTIHCPWPLSRRAVSHVGVWGCLLAGLAPVTALF